MVQLKVAGMATAADITVVDGKQM